MKNKIFLLLLLSLIISCNSFYSGEEYFVTQVYYDIEFIKDTVYIYQEPNDSIIHYKKIKGNHTICAFDYVCNTLQSHGYSAYGFAIIFENFEKISIKDTIILPNPYINIIGTMGTFNVKYNYSEFTGEFIVLQKTPYVIINYIDTLKAVAYGKNYIYTENIAIGKIKYKEKPKKKNLKKWIYN